MECGVFWQLAVRATGPGPAETPSLEQSVRRHTCCLLGLLEHFAADQSWLL